MDARDTTANWLESDVVTDFSPWASSQNATAGPTAVRLDTFVARPAALPSAAGAQQTSSLSQSGAAGGEPTVGALGLTAAAALLALGGVAGPLWRRRRTQLAPDERQEQAS